MKNLNHNQTLSAQDRFGLRVAARLSGGTTQLPHEIAERLRAARVQAVVQRRMTRRRTAPQVIFAGAAAVLGRGDEGWNFWNRVASALPLIALVVGLITIQTVQNERRANEVAEVDAALLTDDLPPAAYADPGFVQFLKSGDE